MRKKLLFAALLVLLIGSIVIAVDWYPTVFKESWNRRSTGFCSADSQCLVSSAGNRAFDAIPAAYFSNIKPYCINTTQFILDNYCENGKWSSRTKVLALELLKIANTQSPNDFSLYCTTPENALNNLLYDVGNIPVGDYFKDCYPYNSASAYACTNSVCVLKYGNEVAFGTSLNIPISDSMSFLKALGVSASKCNSEKNNNNQFDLCGDNIWYNHNTESIIVMPLSYSGTNLPISAANPEPSFITQPFTILNSLATTSNISYFTTTRLFNNLYFAKKNNKEVFSFLEKDQTEFSYDYIGLYMNNAGLTNFCDDIIYNVDSNVVCDDSGSLLVIAEKTPDMDDSLVALWADLTAKLRLS